MTDIVAAYWGPRLESPADGAARLEALLTSLAHCGVEAWFEKGDAHPTPAQAADVTATGLEQLLEAGQNRRDTDGTPIPELGYRVSLWNGDNDHPVEVSTQLGVTSTTPGVANSALIKLPSEPRLRAEATTLFRDLVEAFEPVRASWMTREYRRSQTTFDGAAWIGWQTYLDARLATYVGPLPPGVRSGPLGDGTWLTVGDEPGPESVELAGVVAKNLTV